MLLHVLTPPSPFVASIAPPPASFTSNRWRWGKRRSSARDLVLGQHDCHPPGCS